MHVVSTQCMNNLFKSRCFSDFVKYEWLYSSIDRYAFTKLIILLRSVFCGANDFQIVLKNNFSRLKTRQLTRSQWTCLRRMTGRPRRFSFAFLEEERRILHEKRQQVAFIQECLHDFPPSSTNAKHIQNVLSNLPGLQSIPLKPTPGTAVCMR